MTIFPAALSLCYHQPIQMKRSIIIAHVSHKQFGMGRNIHYTVKSTESKSMLKMKEKKQKTKATNQNKTKQNNRTASTNNTCNMNNIMSMSCHCASIC